MHCTRVIDNKMCESTDRVKVNKDGFWVCRSCRIAVVTSQLYKSDKAMLEANTPTTIYVLLTPNITIKIGRAVNLYRRMQELHREDFGGRMTLLASFQGTHIDEAELHIRFNDYRVTTALGEQFFDVPEIRDWAASIGIDSVGADAARRYAMYTPKNEPKKNPDYQLPALTDEEINEIMNDIEVDW